MWIFFAWKKCNSRLVWTHGKYFLWTLWLEWFIYDLFMSDYGFLLKYYGITETLLHNKMYYKYSLIAEPVVVWSYKWTFLQIKDIKKWRLWSNLLQFSNVLITKKSLLHLQHNCQISHLLIRALEMMVKQRWQPLCVPKLPPKQIPPTLHEIHSWSH